MSPEILLHVGRIAAVLLDEVLPIVNQKLLILLDVSGAHQEQAWPAGHLASRLDSTSDRIGASFCHVCC